MPAPAERYVGRSGAPTAQSHQFVSPVDRRKHGGVKVDFQNLPYAGMRRDYAGRGGVAWQEGPSPVRTDWRSTADVLRDVGRIAHQAAFAVHAETVPSEQKFVGLSAQVDRFGDSVARVHHQSNEFDAEAHAFATQVGHDFATKSGAAEIFRPDNEFTNGHHHIGTLRMGARPNDSVVDAHGRVHGYSNLYVAGASTFPSSSSMNPTLTLVALAIRTAEHLHATLP